MAKVKHEGPDHGDVTLSLMDETADGGRHYRSWTVCECSPLLARLRQLLGPAEHETVATAEAFHATAAAVLQVPGAVHFGKGF